MRDPNADPQHASRHDSRHDFRCDSRHGLWDDLWDDHQAMIEQLEHEAAAHDQQAFEHALLAAFHERIAAAAAAELRALGRPDQ